MSLFKFSFFCGLAFFFGVFLLPDTVYAQEEEVRERIWKLEFEGNRSFQDVVLRNIIASSRPGFWARTFFTQKKRFYLTEDEIRRDAIRIERFYNRRGFEQAKVSWSVEDLQPEWKKEVTFLIEEGNPVLIRNVMFRVHALPEDSLVIFANRDFSRAVSRQEFQTGKRYQIIKEPEIEARLLAPLKNMGYAKAEVKVERVLTGSPFSVDVRIEIIPRNKYYYSGITVEGNELFRDWLVIRESGLQAGQLYSDSGLREAQRELFGHPIIKFATIGVEETESDSLMNLTLRIREQSMRSIQLLFGLSTEVELDGQYGFLKIFRGQVSWTHRNVRNLGERFTATIRASSIEQTLAFDYLFPYAFNTNSSVLISPTVQHRLEPSFEIVTGGIRNNFIYEYTRNITATAAYEFTVNREISRNTFRNLPDSVNNFNISSFSFSGYYQEGFLKEQDGWVIQPFLEVSGIFKEASFSFQKASLEARKFTKVTPGLTLATRVRGGGIFFAGNDSLPSNIRFFTGGGNTVRGWSRENLGPKRPIFNEDGSFDRFIPIGGRALANANIELRQRLNFIKGLEIAAFIDGGQIWGSVREANISDLQFGGGGGLRYNSPIGPIRIDFARKLNPNNQDLEILNGIDFGNFWSRHQIHFSIGQAF